MSEGYAVKVRPEKQAAVADIKTELGEAQAAVVTEYRGLTVEDLKTLRTRLLEVDATYRVSKNTLARLAANELGLDLDEILVGPTAIAYVKGDPVAAAKVIATFAKEKVALVIKGGVLEGRVLTGDETKNLATVDSLDVSRAKIAGMLVAPLQRIVMLLEAPAGRILFVLEELAKRGPAAEEPTPEASSAPDVQAQPEPEAEAAPPAEPQAEQAEGQDTQAESPSEEPPAEASAETQEETTETETTEGE